MTFLRNTWYVGAWSADVAAGTLVARTLLDEPIVFARTASGEVTALYDRCPHRFAALSRGRVSGEVVVCGYHGLQYDRTGACILNPHGNKTIPPGAIVRRFPTVEKHSIVWIWMGTEAPRPAEIPDFSVLDHAQPTFVSKRDYIVRNRALEKPPVRPLSESISSPRRPRRRRTIILPRSGSTRRSAARKKSSQFAMKFPITGDSFSRARTNR